MFTQPVSESSAREHLYVGEHCVGALVLRDGVTLARLSDVSFSVK